MGSQVFIPEENEDIADLPDSVKDGLKIIPVTHVSEVLAQALVDQPLHRMGSGRRIPRSGTGQTGQKQRPNHTLIKRPPDYRAFFYPPHSNRAFHPPILNRIRDFVMSTMTTNAFEAKFARSEGNLTEMMALRQIADRACP